MLIEYNWLEWFFRVSTGSPSYEPHEQCNMALNYKGLYGIFYKRSMEVVCVLFAPGVIILHVPIELDQLTFWNEDSK